MALPAQLPDNEAERLLSVRALISADGPSTPELEALVKLAKDVFTTPYAAVNIVDADWHRVACQVGIRTSECPRDISICSRVVFDNEVVVVPDLARHPELRDMYFGHYTTLVYLAQTEDPALTRQAEAAAEKLGLAFERRHTGFGELASALEAAV